MKTNTVWIAMVLIIVVVGIAVADCSYVQVSAGQFHTLAVKADGTVWSWGRNEFGQLGNGTTDSTNIPIQVWGLTNVIAVDAGDDHSLALLSDGTVWSWGKNTDGQLGDGTMEDNSIPAMVEGLSDVIAISAGYNHSMALKNDGTVWSWGGNIWGQLGDGTVMRRYHPVIVVGLSNVTNISAGGGFSLALIGDGTVKSWGLNFNGQLGDSGIEFNRMSPICVMGLYGVTAISAGNYHSLVIIENGTVWSWGGNFCGQLGDGTRNIDRTVPVIVLNLYNVVSISAGWEHSIAMTSDKQIMAWGFNEFGCVGDETDSIRLVPVSVHGLNNPIRIIAGGYHSVALNMDGSISSWGWNEWGQLGDGTWTDSWIPVSTSCGVPTEVIGHGMEIGDTVNNWAYPNPFNDVLRVGQENVTIWNMNGEIVAEGTGMIQMGMVGAGTYIVQNHSGKSMIVEKVK